MRINQWLLLLLLTLRGCVQSLPPHSHQAPSAASNWAMSIGSADYWGLEVAVWILHITLISALLFSLSDALSLFDQSVSRGNNSGFVKEQM